MRLKATKREKIFERYNDKAQNYRYFFYEEDFASEIDIEMFGYSKFLCDEAYSDEKTSWNYIILNDKIVGILGISRKDTDLRIKFIEIHNKLRGKGIGTQVIEFLKSFEGIKTITLYPKNSEIAENFYRPLGFEYIGKEEMQLKI
ncbi:MAG: GNAT family N-acetyltransferase [Clostridia bacterium]|nr:GNAT family N-acetyltransferase [Clostridia bacterium]